MHTSTSAVTGTLSVFIKGFGFLTEDDGTKHFVPPALARQFAPGDVLRAQLEPSRKQAGSMQARSLELENRPRKVWLGTVEMDGGRHWLICDEPCLVPLELLDVGYVAPGTVVSARTVVDNSGPVQLRLERIIGERGSLAFYNAYAAARSDFAMFFPPAALEAAAKAEVLATTRPQPARRNLTHLPFVTIDGEETHDFDDAVYAEQSEVEGMTRVLVAISDVSFYVRPGSVLDAHARMRGTSVYLPGFTCPMLPPAISNGLCSLVPGKARCVVVVDVDVDARGHVTRTDVYRASIRSAARLTYEQVETWLQTDARVPENTVASLELLDKVYLARAALHPGGDAMTSDDREPKLKHHADLAPTVEFSGRLSAHKLVEECMLLANAAVAKMLPKPGLFRHQAPPSAEARAEVVAWAAAHGVSAPDFDRGVAGLAGFVNEARAAGKGQLAQFALYGLAESATYSVQDTEHFALGESAYTHFTSPIRRYSDLLVHRILLDGVGAVSGLEFAAAHCTERAAASRSAERFVWDHLKRQNLLAKVAPADHTPAIILHCSPNGLRVVVTAYQSNAMVPARELTGAGYRFDVATKAWSLGEEVLESGTDVTITNIQLQFNGHRADCSASIVLAAAAGE